MISLDDYIYEKFTKFSETIPKKGNQWVKIDPKKYPELEDEFFWLIHIAYQPIGGHVKFKKAKDVFSYPDLTFWKAKDVDDDGDFDLVFYGKETRYGIKSSGVGHDGSKEAKREYLKGRAKDLKRLGFYVEASHKFAEILMQKYNVPVVTDPEVIEKVLGRDIVYYGEHPEGQHPGTGWYSRIIAKQRKVKVLLGRPKA